MPKAAHLSELPNKPPFLATKARPSRLSLLHSLPVRVPPVRLGAHFMRKFEPVFVTPELILRTLNVVISIRHDFVLNLRVTHSGPESNPPGFIKPLYRLYCLRNRDQKCRSKSGMLNSNPQLLVAFADISLFRSIFCKVTDISKRALT